MYELTIYRRADLAHIPQRATHLRLITDEATPLSAEEVDGLPAGLRGLRVKQISQGAIARIAQRLSGLEELGMMTGGLPAGALAPLAGLAGLRVVELNLERLEPPELAPLAQIHALSCIRVDHAQQITAQLAALAGLRSLTLHTFKLNTPDVAQLAAMPALESLTLWTTTVIMWRTTRLREQDALCALSSAPALRKLVLRDVCGISAAEIAGLASIPTLQAVGLELYAAEEVQTIQPLHDTIHRLFISASAGAWDQALAREVATRLPRIRGLHLTRSETPLGDEDALAWVGQLKRLTWLSLDSMNSKIKPRALAWLGDLSELEHLSLCGVRLGATVLDPLKDSAALRTLQLEGVKVSDAALEKLSGLRLEALGIKRAALTDKGLASIAGMTTLETLALTLERGKLGDVGIKALGSISGLRALELELYDSAYTASTLAPLAELPALTYLHIDAQTAKLATRAGGLWTLANAPALTHLELGQRSRGDIDPAEAAALDSIPNLLHLNGVTGAVDALRPRVLVTDMAWSPLEIVAPMSPQ
jgi:hypothetical protein